MTLTSPLHRCPPHRRSRVSPLRARQFQQWVEDALGVRSLASAPATRRWKFPKASACRSRSARARSKTSSATATSRWAPPCTPGQRRGNASTSDFSRAALEQTVRAAHDIARFTAEDPRRRLAGPGRHGAGQGRIARPRPVPPLGHRRRARAADRAALRGRRPRRGRAHHQFRRRGRVGAAIAFLRRQQPRVSRRLRKFSPFAVGGPDRGPWRRDAARRLVHLDAVGRPDGLARGRRALCCRARAVAAEVAQDQDLRGAGAVRVDRWLPACWAATCRPPAAGRCTASRASCRTAWASACCPSTSTSTKTRTSCAARAARPSTMKVCSHASATWCVPAWCRAISCRPTRPASSGCAPPATRAARTTWR